MVEPFWSCKFCLSIYPSSYSILAEKNMTKNILEGRTDRGKTVYPPPPSGTGGIILILNLEENNLAGQEKKIYSDIFTV
jgi:hypothetical protein